jgi:integrase
MAKSFRFNKTKLLTLIRQGDPTTVRDTEEKSLRFKVGKKRSVFLFEKRISGRKNTPPVTITIGAFPAITIDEARWETRRLANLCEKGVDPRVGPEEEERPVITLKMAVDKFVGIKKEGISKRCFGKYRNIIQAHLPVDWMDKDLNTITSDLLYEQFHLVRKAGRHQCCEFLKVFGNIWNTTAPLFRDRMNLRILGANPVPETRKLLKGISKAPINRPVIPAPLLGKFLVTVENLRSGEERMFARQSGPPSPNVVRLCNIVLLSLFTGFRFSEARCLLWEYVNLEHGIIFLPGDTSESETAFEGTKNTQDHWIPLSTYAWDLLAELKRERTSLSPYVFPGSNKTFQPVSRNDAVFHRISELVGTKFSPHATRRTFASVADEAGLGFIKVKRLLNHAFKGGVTGGYIVNGFNPAKERESIQLICDYILERRAAYLGHGEMAKGIDKDAAFAKLRRYSLELGLDPSEVLVDVTRKKTTRGVA